MIVNEQLRQRIKELEAENKQLKRDVLMARMQQTSPGINQAWRERLREAINSPAAEIIVRNDDVFAALCEITLSEIGR